MADIRNFTLNFGPQHPAATACCALSWNWTAKSSSAPTPHRPAAPPPKTGRTRTWVQSVPYMDRLDYVSMMCNEHAYCLATEKLLGVEVPVRGKYIRTMFDEITRILNHLLVDRLSCPGRRRDDHGLYTFREREDLMDVYEAVSGARLHAAYYRPGASIATCRTACRSTSRPPGPARRRPRNSTKTASGSLLDFLDDFTNRFPTYRANTTPADR